MNIAFKLWLILALPAYALVLVLGHCGFYGLGAFVLGVLTGSYAVCVCIFLAD